MIEINNPMLELQNTMININNKWYNYDRVTITGTEKNDRVIEYNV